MRRRLSVPFTIWLSLASESYWRWDLAVETRRILHIVNLQQIGRIAYRTVLNLAYYTPFVLEQV